MTSGRKRIAIPGAAYSRKPVGWVRGCLPFSRKHAQANAVAWRRFCELHHWFVGCIAIHRKFQTRRAAEDSTRLYGEAAQHSMRLSVDGYMPQARTRLPMSNARVRVGYAATHPTHGTRPLRASPFRGGGFFNCKQLLTQPTNKIIVL